VTLHVLDNVFRHNLAFEPPQGVLQRLAFLQSNFCHSRHPARPVSIGYLRAYSLLCCFPRSQLCNSIIYFGESLHIFQLFLIQPEVVAQFMDDRQADLFADFGLAGADGFNILLIKHDVIRPSR
jgi:hypothetical protein